MPHAAHRETIVHCKYRRFYPAEHARAAHGAVFFARLFAQLFEFFGIAGKIEDIARFLFREQLFEIFKAHTDARARVYLAIVPALGAHAVIGGKLVL